MIAMYVLSTVYSWPFAIGSACGLIGQRLYCYQKAQYLDRHDPLPNGAKHKVDRLSRVWVAGLVLALSLGYVLLSATKAQVDTVALAQRVSHCWVESYEQTRAQITLNAENDAISRQQQQLQRDYDRATSDWLKALVTPPGDLANQPTNSPERQAWGLQITGVYQGQLNELGAKFDNLVTQRANLDTERAKHPLPEATCGK